MIIDEPRGIYWGGSVAAPVFREIAKKALRYLNVPSGMNRIYTVSTKSDKSNHSRLNAGLEINSVRNNINVKIKESIDKFLGRVIAGLKAHYWEKDKNA